MGSTGKMWAHEHWFLNDGADIVTFGGKAGISGFYTTIEYRQNDQAFEQNVDLIKLLNYGIVWKTIQKKDLLSYVMDTSQFLKIELIRIQNEIGTIKNIRGNGTFIGFETSGP
jgi:4-aminobutyrate aminotransferase/(S)-3-amino-2-methylpropionate transaminase